MKYQNIDFARWNKTIDEVQNSLPYAYSWYLDAVSPNWEALVTDDYTYVMPLPVKRKFGFKYLIQPYWVQQLGIFSSQKISDEIVSQFLHKIPYFSYDFTLNFANKSAEELPNKIIDLEQSYVVVSEKYVQNTRRNIAKAQTNNLSVSAITCEEFIDFWYSNGKHISADSLQCMQKLAQSANLNNIGRFYGVKSIENQLIAALFTLETPKRIINLAPVSNKQGKEYSAMFLLIDYLLKINAESGKIFDFEGSKIPGVARFYDGFGATEQNYYHIKRGRPEWFVKLLHR